MSSHFRRLVSCNLIFHSWLKKIYLIQQFQSYTPGFIGNGNTALVEYVYAAYLALCNSFLSFPSWFLLCQSPKDEGWLMTQKERENTWKEPLAQVCLWGSCCTEPVQLLYVTSWVSRGDKQDRKRCWHRAVEKHCCQKGILEVTWSNPLLKRGIFASAHSSFKGKTKHVHSFKSRSFPRAVI